MKKKTNTILRSRLLLITILLVFFGPLLVAYIWFNNIEEWGAPAAIHHGELFQPARLLSLENLQNRKKQLVPADYLLGRWHIVYVMAETQCGEICKEQMYHGRQIRTGLGRDRDRVNRILITHVDMSGVQQKWLKETHPDVTVLTVRDDFSTWVKQLGLPTIQDDFQSGVLYLVDPRGFLALGYHSGANPKDMMMDLKRLLKISKLG